MPVHTLDPLADRRWAAFVREHPQSSIFHTTGWLEALSKTYGYRPVAFSTSGPGEGLRNAIVFCEIRSWLTGSRLVSLPFSDHCAPLVDDAAQEQAIVSHVLEARQRTGWRYVEMRVTPGAPPIGGMTTVQEAWSHALDLGPTADGVFGRFHHGCIQRKIRRAEREGLLCEEGRGEASLQAFYRLVVQTRRRHGVPPQPLAWFRALLAELGDAATLRIARFEGRPVAGMLTIRHRDTVVYKYGASDDRSHALGGMPLLFWKAVQDGCRRGCTTLDLGRSELGHEGLVRFKDRLGARRVPLVNRRSDFRSRQGSGRLSLGTWSRRVIGHLPDQWCIAVGRALYRHAG